MSNKEKSKKSWMNAEIIPFDFHAREIRTRIDDRGDPWFVAKDVCEVLEISDHYQAVEILDEDERGRYKLRTPRGTQKMLVINESGLYNLIFRSHKPAAKIFRKWVTKEVLPTLRKRGLYCAIPEGPLPDDLRQTGESYKSIMERIGEAQRLMKALRRYKRRLERQIIALCSPEPSEESSKDPSQTFF